MPPPARQDKTAFVSATASTDKVLAQLRDLADPELTGSTRTMHGGTTGMGAVVSVPRSAPAVTDPALGDRLLYQTKVGSFVKNSVEVTAPGRPRRGPPLAAGVLDTGLRHHRHGRPPQGRQPAHPGAAAAVTALGRSPSPRTWG